MFHIYIDRGKYIRRNSIVCTVNRRVYVIRVYVCVRTKDEEKSGKKTSNKKSVGIVCTK